MTRQNRHNANTITGREMPWDVMGHALKPSSTTNLTKALKDAGLDYQVETWDVQATRPTRDGSGQTLSADRSQALVRPMPDGSMKVVGVTGTRFTPIHNSDAFGIATDLVGDFGATIAGLADFRHGGASVLALALPKQDVTLQTPDRTEDVTGMHLLIRNAHDGSSALTFAITPVRMDCTNVLPVAIKGAKRVWKINHTPNAMDRVDLAREAIREALGFSAAFQVQAQAMMDQRMTDAEFAKIVARLVPVKDDAEGAVAERKREQRAQIINLRRDSVTLDHGVRDTLWGGYQTFTEYLDWYRPVKGDAAIARAEGAIDGPNVRRKMQMWDLFSSAV